MLNKLKYPAGLAIILFMLTAPATFAQQFVEQKGKPVTPYGDFCSLCSTYGICTIQSSPEKAERAIRDYYNKKGLDVEIEEISGRFIKAKVKDKGKIVDTILFDSSTGRFRSIY
ncbi:hypothetical protein MNBD_NITROSPIRAE02-495 [hydrothermal vent metagenome]|uniref:PepSY domain-containing protein n=1 Tax=hydrothermal vent metagenome TaxID=652676 RepID=A0A3B1CRZ2_9ZZZZ